MAPFSTGARKGKETPFVYSAHNEQLISNLHDDVCVCVKEVYWPWSEYLNSSFYFLLWLRLYALHSGLANQTQFRFYPKFQPFLLLFFSSKIFFSCYIWLFMFSYYFISIFISLFIFAREREREMPYEYAVVWENRVKLLQVQSSQLEM